MTVAWAFSSFSSTFCPVCERVPVCQVRLEHRMPVSVRNLACFRNLRNATGGLASRLRGKPTSWGRRQRVSRLACPPRRGFRGILALPLMIVNAQQESNRPAAPPGLSYRYKLIPIPTNGMRARYPGQPEPIQSRRWQARSQRVVGTALGDVSVGCRTNP